MAPAFTLIILVSCHEPCHDFRVLGRVPSVVVPCERAGIGVSHLREAVSSGR